MAAASARGTPMQKGSLLRATPAVGAPGYSASCTVNGTLNAAKDDDAKQRAARIDFFIISEAGFYYLSPALENNGIGIFRA
jgi:hypothetical protein